MIKLKRFLYLFLKKTMISFLVLSLLMVGLPNINDYIEVEALGENFISPLALIPENSNPNFTLQHYFYFDKVTTTTATPSGNYITFINTSVGTPGEFPSNTNIKNNVLEGITNFKTPKTTNVPLVTNSSLSNSRMEVATKRELIRLFEDEPTNYITNPQIQYMNRLYNSATDYNSNFTLEEIWVYQPNDDGSVKNINTLTENDFIKYPVPWSADGTRHEPEKMRFTNNPNNSHINAVINKIPIISPATEDYPYYYTILIQSGTVIRLVFNTTAGELKEDANLFDYDITDGYIYTTYDASETNRRATSSQTTSAKWYANVYNSGINNDTLYTGTGPKYAFGNSNYTAPTGKGDIEWTFNGTNFYLNRYNSKNYQGVAFGILNGFTLNSNNKPIPIWYGNISAPPIFDDTKDVIGKTDYTKEKGNGYKLGFNRTGTDFTLDKVIDSKNNTVLHDLRGIMVTATNSLGPIYSNEFWPLDTSASYGTDGHDFKFGNSAYTRHFFSSINPGTSKAAPAADKSADHNSYFGMTYSVDFTVYPGYTSPLDYWFYGDDDMWVFLSKLDANGNVIVGSEKKIIDIGGIHSAVGVYSNLWEYLDYNPLFNDDGTENTTAQDYRITVFYTERGASGSSCYMRFTLPLETSVATNPIRDEAIMFEKSYLDENGKEIEYDENGEQFHFLLTMTNEKGISYEDIYDYAIYRKELTPDHSSSTATPIESGVIGMVNPNSGKYEFDLRSGEYIIISNLPDDTYYTIEEIGSENYDTYYQTGTHKHINNRQVDTLNLNKVETDLGIIERYNLKSVNYVKFTNSALTYKNLIFNKVDAQSLSPLSQAKFNIYEYVCDNPDNLELIDITSQNSCWHLYNSAISDENGLTTFRKLYKNKRYRLVETKAPDGYKLPSGQWNIDVSDDLEFTITAVGTELPLAFIEDNGNLLLPNVKDLTIPETGSNSIFYIILGTLFIGFGFFLSIYLNRKKFYN